MWKEKVMWKNERTKIGFEKSSVLYVTLDNTSQADKSVEFESRRDLILYNIIELYKKRFHIHLLSEFDDSASGTNVVERNG